MSVENKFGVGDKVKWNDYDYWQGFHKEDVAFEDTLTVVGYVDGPLVELQSDSGVVVTAFDWRFELVESFHPAPEAKDENGMFNEWFKRGELPPVGANIEYKLGAGPWFEATVKYVLEVLDCDEDEIVIACPHLGFEQLLTLNKRTKIRPALSHEDIAKQKREKAINEMDSVVKSYGSWEICADLYDAGYRLVGEDK